MKYNLPAAIAYALRKARANYFSSTGEAQPIDALRAVAATGDAEAQYLLYARYATGPAPELGSAEAQTWLAKSTEQGFPPALYLTALLQIQERGAGGVPPQALFYLEIAGDRGYTDAYLQLYQLYLRGEGVEASKERARHFLRKAMDQGSATAFLIVAQNLLPSGVSNSVDYDACYYYAEQAAQLGSQEAVDLIIDLLEANLVEGDHTELLTYWRRQRRASA